MPRKKLEDTAISGVLAERQTEDGRRRISLSNRERRDLGRSAQIEGAIVLLLDISTPKKLPEIAEELGISVHVLKELFKTDEFNEKYNAYFAELGHDPRYKASQAALSDMLPYAITTLQRLMLDPITPPSVRMRAVEHVIKLNSLSAPQHQEFDRKALVDLLSKNNITINNYAPPAEYASVANDLNQLIEGQAEEVPVERGGEDEED